eukprot:CAMPEP_0201495792 /NCGR_PEP_ID=MMETSP0151_2-20130828/56045_1 /ASSEMBLY_ACC=CAM_ASM_000257 /TAXON_ID=200890 /ORGANISM="Paramoeba atlantica, Strain 621/1 / CCAP 1560/9" /LENGTH=370 /DNA_ID=CAMNT_0047885089 /DNA_START=1 /DNA_END=1110 /DNA_ORIENTATION=-
MFFTLNPATKITFGGERIVHSLFQHQFASQSPSLSLCVQARSFSAFILLVGRVFSATEFSPEAALLVRNKEDFKIPLMVETIPTAQEFEDAIESLSDEQKAFAQAYRKLQLASTLFGVCVLQIKPQLERILKLPEFSLTKEIELIEEILELFIKFQIPSDLFAYDQHPSAPSHEKVSRVRENVQNVQKVIQSIQQEEKISPSSLSIPYIFSMLEKERKELKSKFVRNPPQWREEEPPESIVVDAGSIFVKGGFFGDFKPRVLNRCVVGRPRHVGVMVGMGQKDSFGGGSAEPPDLGGDMPDSTQETTEERKDEKKEEEEKGDKNKNQREEEEGVYCVDFSAIPIEVDKMLLKLDPKSNARPSILSLGKIW